MRNESGGGVSPSNGDMKIISVNAGVPRELEWNGGSATTAIFKNPIAGPVRVDRLNISGDRQADLAVHGGPYKAVYGYPSEHYAYWRAELPGDPLPWGAFGENLTTEGLLESAVGIGDRFRVGTTELVVTQPRTPCYKLGIRFGSQEIIKRFLDSRRSGFYFAVAKEGELQGGDAIELLSREAESLTISEVNDLYISDHGNREMLERAARLPSLPEKWRGYFRERLREAANSSGA